jgi:hypothetical protein
VTLDRHPEALGALSAHVRLCGECAKHLTMTFRGMNLGRKAYATSCKISASCSGMSTMTS